MSRRNGQNSILGSAFTICDANGGEILKMHEDDYLKGEYALFYDNPADEIPGLLLMMTCDLIMHPKGDKTTFSDCDVRIMRFLSAQKNK